MINSKVKVAVVVLNYMNYTETFHCVDSILLQEGIDFKIIIVENGSSNGSFEKIKKRYNGNKLIHIIKANKNYGFARGNNIGIHYAREKLSADFVLLLNSDIIVTHKKYISILISEYQEGIGVIGSKIIQKGGYVEENYRDYVEFPEVFAVYFAMICEYLEFHILAEEIFSAINQKKKTEILHGSCFMLTPSFFKYYKSLYPKTFLYGEEILLYIYCKKAGLSQKKIEEIAVLHKGRQSSKSLYDNNAYMRNKYILSSYKYILWESAKYYFRDKLRIKI